MSDTYDPITNELRDMQHAAAAQFFAFEAKADSPAPPSSFPALSPEERAAVDEATKMAGMEAVLGFDPMLSRLLAIIDRLSASVQGQTGERDALVREIGRLQEECTKLAAVARESLQERARMLGERIAASRLPSAETTGELNAFRVAMDAFEVAVHERAAYWTTESAVSRHGSEFDVKTRAAVEKTRGALFESAKQLPTPQDSAPGSEPTTMNGRPYGSGTFSSRASSPVEEPT